FEESARHLLEPGDMLYLPPRLAHYGIAQNDCITLSVGFRAPSHRQAIEGMMEHLLEQTPEHLFVADATRERSAHPAEIDRATLQKVRETLIHYLNDEHQIAHWFGRFATEPKNPSILIPDESLADTRQLLQAIQNTELLCNEGSRIAYTLEKERLCLFIDGEDMALREYDLDWVQLLCDEQAIALTAIHSLETRDDLQCYLLNCIQQGSLLLEEIEH
ncbi:MAG: cupin domain-containing protein, partial [Oleiphilaceae bacterium]|nr:cupin domain-containing protein [Oleiphilaceae bacterium]